MSKDRILYRKVFTCGSLIAIFFRCFYSNLEPLKALFVKIPLAVIRVLALLDSLVMGNLVKTKMNVTLEHMIVTFCHNVKICLEVIPVRVALEHLEMEHTVNNYPCLLYSLPLEADQIVLAVVMALKRER